MFQHQVAGYVKCCSFPFILSKRNLITTIKPRNTKYIYLLNRYNFIYKIIPSKMLLGFFAVVSVYSPHCKEAVRRILSKASTFLVVKFCGERETRYSNFQGRRVFLQNVGRPTVKNVIEDCLFIGLHSIPELKEYRASVLVIKIKNFCSNTETVPQGQRHSSQILYHMFTGSFWNAQFPYVTFSSLVNNSIPQVQK
jgi:hypothetical protein